MTPQRFLIYSYGAKMCTDKLWAAAIDSLVGIDRDLPQR